MAKPKSQDVGQTLYFALYLPDGLPLTGERARIEIDRHGDIPAVYLTVTLDQDSAEDLDRSKVLGDLYLPEPETALESFEVDFDLIAKDAVCERFSAFLRETEHPAAEILDGRGPSDAGEPRSPFLNIDSYLSRGHAVREELLADEEVIALAKKPPKAL